MRMNYRFRVLVVLVLVTWAIPVQLYAGCGGKSCAAGVGASCGYSRGRQPIMVSGGGGGLITEQRAHFARQWQAAAQAAANREAALRRKAVANQKLLEVAQEADKAGDLVGAARLYLRLALARPSSRVTESAQARLSEIQGQAGGEFQAIEDQLKQLRGADSALKPVLLDGDKVTDLFNRLDKVAIEYAGVDTVDSRLQTRLDRLRGTPQFAAILQEPAAAELWKVAQKHESIQQTCCAMQVYEQAATLIHAPSGRKARERLTALQKDEGFVAESRLCRNLQVCHEKFRRAELLKESNPTQSREYLAEIVEIAPPDTSIFRAAREQIAMLP